MTIIAVAGDVMAADSMDTIGALRVTCPAPKITRRQDGALIGIAGHCPCVEAFRVWWLAGADPNNRPVAAPDADESHLDALELLPGGLVTRYDYHARPYRVVNPYAIGSESAGIMVKTALLCGKTLAQAVALACEHVIHVGGPIQVEHLAATSLAAAA